MLSVKKKTNESGKSGNNFFDRIRIALLELKQVMRPEHSERQTGDEIVPAMRENSRRADCGERARAD